MRSLCSEDLKKRHLLRVSHYDAAFARFFEPASNLVSAHGTTARPPPVELHDQHSGIIWVQFRDKIVSVMRKNAAEFRERTLCERGLLTFASTPRWRASTWQLHRWNANPCLDTNPSIVCMAIRRVEKGKDEPTMIFIVVSPRRLAASMAVSV